MSKKMDQAIVPVTYLPNGRCGPKLIHSVPEDVGNRLIGRLGRFVGDPRLRGEQGGQLRLPTRAGFGKD